MWFSQERSWQIVRPRSLNERSSSGGLLRKLMVGVFQTVLSERHRESVRFVRIERHVPHVGPACDFIQICRVKRLLLADLRDDRWYGRGWSHQQREKEDFPASERSLKTRKRTVPRTLPLRTPAWTGRGDERTPFRATRCLRQEMTSVSHEWRCPWIP